MSTTVNENGPNSTTGSVNFLVPPTDPVTRPYLHANANSAGELEKNYKEELHTIVVENLRGKEDSVTLDSAGFQYFRHASKHTTFVDDDEIKKEYYPESVDLIKKLTGASRVVLFDHTVRRRIPGTVDDSPDKRQPVPIAHGDQTTKSAIARVHRHLPESDAPELLKKCFQIINLWRPIGNPAWDWPLALCDYRSVKPDQDTVPVRLIFPHREGETLGVKYSPEYRWKYVYGLTPEEGVLIKCFDSIQDGSVAVFTPHTAFEDPATPKDAPYRQSIELRALVFYD